MIDIGSDSDSNGTLCSPGAAELRNSSYSGPSTRVDLGNVSATCTNLVIPDSSFLISDSYTHLTLPTKA